MSDGSGTTPEEPAIRPADAVVPPPPPETPIPEGLLTPPPSEIPVADAVIPPPPPEARLRSAERPRPALLEGDQPAAAADDWAKPSVAPEVPTSGGYRGLTVAIFAFLFALFAIAIGLLIYLLSTGSFPFVVFDTDAAALSFALTSLL